MKKILPFLVLFLIWVNPAVGSTGMGTRCFVRLASENPLLDAKEVLVRTYYFLMDHNTVATTREALRIFDSDAVYERGNREPLTGLPDIEAFYLGTPEQAVTRKLVGKHFLHSLIVEGNTVSVSGRFEGNVEIVFTDQWVFGENQKVRFRKSTLRDKDEVDVDY